jgi:hypothetical protein
MEAAVRKYLDATKRGVPAKLVYLAEFKDAPGNPVVTKCRIQLIDPGDVKIVDITVDMVTSKAINNLQTVP